MSRLAFSLFLIAFIWFQEGLSATDILDDLKVNEKTSEKEMQKKLIATEVLVSESEEKALKHLKALIKKYKGTSMEPGLKFRLAELYMNRAKSARFIEQAAEDEQGVLSFLPKKIATLKEKKMVAEAIREYAEIEQNFKKYGQLDQVIFNRAFALLQIGEEVEAEKAFISLLKKRRRSSLRPDTFLAIGEINFKRRNFKKALAYFSQVKKFKDARVYPYGMYKASWSFYNLKAYTQSIAELESVIRYGAMVEQQGKDQRLDLRTEALTDMALFYSEIRSATDSVAYFINLAGNKSPIPALSRLSRIYEKHGKDPSQEIVLLGMIKTFKGVKETPLFYKNLTENLDRQSKYKKATTSLWAFQSNCKKTEQKFKDVDEYYCREGVTKLSKKMALKWLRIYKKNKKNALMAAVAEQAFKVHLKDQKLSDENSKMRFLFAEHLFDQKKFLKSSKQYDLVGDSTKDQERKRKARYAAIFSYDSAYKSEFSKETSKSFRTLSQKYMKDFPQGDKYLDVGFKLALYDYKNKNYELASPLLLELGEKYKDVEKGKKSQDFFLDILNAQKKYVEIQSYAKKFKKTEKDLKRQASLQNLFEQSFFAEVQALEAKKDYKKSLQRYSEFINANSDAKLINEARWNKIAMHFKLKEYNKTAEGYISYQRLHPKSPKAIPGLVKAVEIYEMMAEPEKALRVTNTLKAIDAKNSHRWSYLSAGYLRASGRYEDAAKSFLPFILNVKSQFRYQAQDEFFALEDSLQKSPWYQTQLKMLSTSPNSNLASSAIRAYTKMVDRMGDKKSLDILVAKNKWNKKINPNTRTLFHYYDGNNKKRRYFSYGISNASMNTIVAGIQKKTKDLDRVQSSYQKALADKDAKVIIDSLVGLSATYDSFVNELKNLRAPASFSPEDTEALKQELDNIIMPFEEKSAEALDQALKVAEDSKIKDGSKGKVKELYNKINLTKQEMIPVKIYEPIALSPRLK